MTSQDPTAYSVGILYINTSPRWFERQKENFFFLRNFIIYYFFFWSGWSPIALQCFVSFCCTTVWISYIYIYNTHTHIFPPSWVSPSTLLRHPRAPSWAPYAIQQLPTSYLFYIIVYIWASEKTPGDSEGKGSLESCSLWDPKKSDMT